MKGRPIPTTHNEPLSYPSMSSEAKIGLPAVAPKATAFSTSDALLTPPSTKIEKLGLGNMFLSLSAATTSTKTSMPERANYRRYRSEIVRMRWYEMEGIFTSSCRPP